MQEELTGAEVKRLLNGDHVPKRPMRQAVCTQLEITIPLPHQATHPNSRGHWAGKSRYTKKQRTDAYHASLNAIERLSTPPFWLNAECQATFYMGRRRDGDGLCSWLKATFDGLQDAGIVVNDSGITHLPAMQVTGKDAGGERKVVLKLRCIGES